MDRGEDIIFSNSDQSQNIKHYHHQNHIIDDTLKEDLRQSIQNDINYKLMKNIKRKTDQAVKNTNSQQVFKNDAWKTGSSENPNQLTNEICNAIYSSLVKDGWLIEKFIYQKTNINDQVKIIKQNTALAEYLSKLSQKKAYKNSSFYKNGINQLQIRTKEQMSKTWSTLSQLEIEQYECIAQNLRNRHSKGKQVTKFYKPQFNARDLFVLDIMAHFMRRNREYQQYFPLQNIKSIITKKTLERLFYDSPLYKQCWERFSDYDEWLYYDFQNDFNELITILSIVELKYRIVLNDCRHAKERDDGDFKKIGKLEFQQRLQSKKEYDKDQKAFKYKYCELAFSQIGSLFSSKTHSIRSQILIKLSKIPYIPSVLGQSRQFLHIKYDYFVTLSSLKPQYNRMQQTVPSYMESSKTNKLIAESDLQNIQWRYLATHKLPDKFRFINSGNSSQFCAFQRLIMKKVCSIGLNRVNLLENVTNIQLQLQKECGRIPIFMLRYSFSYNDMISKKSADKTTLKSKDIRSEVFIAFTEDKILTLSSSRQELNFYFYGYFLRKLFKTLNQSRFVLILNQRRIVWQVYLHLCHYFKQMFDSHVYVSDNQTYFKKHLQLAEYIESCLIANDFSVEDFHNVIQEIIHRIAVVFVESTKKGSGKSNQEAVI